jgi:hypothetical protein
LYTKYSSRFAPSTARPQWIAALGSVGSNVHRMWGPQLGPKLRFVGPNLSPSWSQLVRLSWSWAQSGPGTPSWSHAMHM